MKKKYKKLRKFNKNIKMIYAKPTQLLEKFIKQI